MTLSSAPKNGERDSADPAQIKVMIVDDSAVIRGLLARTLEGELDITVVSSVHNGQMAVSAVNKTKPDVIVLDLEMPIMDGITAIPLLLEQRPEVRILICSTLSRKGASISMKALSLGATDCLVKPTSNSDIGGSEIFHKELLRLVKALGRKKKESTTVSSSPAQKSGSAKSFSLRSKSQAFLGKPAALAIGSSTGGPQALFEVLQDIQNIKVPIFITQHMPKTFTALLAEHIGQKSGIPACEGEEGMTVVGGQIYIAPGGYHMEVVRRDGKIQIAINDDPPENFCKPSVEPMMRSLINIYGNKLNAIMLTGMGNDGVSGFKALAEKGGNIIAQDEQTSVVWGMPGAVAMEGLCTEVLPLNEIGAWIKKNVIEL